MYMAAVALFVRPFVRLRFYVYKQQQTTYHDMHAIKNMLQISKECAIALAS